MDGNFRTDTGALLANNYGGYSDNPTSLFAYNLDHGYLLGCLVEHYKLTGDREWLLKAAPVLVKACDYIFDERRATMVYLVLSSDGILNNLLIQFGATDTAIPFLTKGEYYWTTYTIVNIWKSMGWSSIIYLSAMSGVDEELYQAGAIDGLGRWGMVKHITLPSIAPTIMLLWILGIGNILNAGFDYHLIIGNDATRTYWDVIDTYAYRYGVQQGFYSM